VSRIEASGLVLTYPGRPPVPALRGADLVVEQGTLAAVLGPSGCGKTTLLRCLAGLERSDAGTIALGERVVAGPGAWVAPEQRRIGLVPQEGALFPHLDVAGNLGFGLRGRPRAERRARVDELLELIGLAGYGDRRPSELSGGQQQRVALARALAPEPVAVLLDEPFSALDAGLRGSLRDEVRTTLARAGTTSVLVTHDQTEALTMADVVAVMREGVIVQVGPPDEVYHRPVDLWVARFLGDVVSLPGAPPGRVRACRPEQLQRAEPHADGAFAATVTSVRFGGPDALVDLQVGTDLTTARWPSTHLPEIGDAVTVAVAGPVLDLPADPTGSE
jgi:iron(III) transport system ATP-binding protein